jgi:hypothetical protein
MNRLFRRALPEFRDYVALALFVAAYLLALALVAAPELLIPPLTPEAGVDANHDVAKDAGHA